MRTIKKIHQAEYRPIDNLKTYSPLPSRELDQIDPFLFLNHHGPQQYPPGNSGLPFGPHPHRGMETVTFILDGDIAHQDSGGHKSIIGPGGVQWMTAGRGLIHAEISSEEFRKNGGNLEILQLWINLPSNLKMADPAYTGLPAGKIPVIYQANGEVTINLISGEFQGTSGAFKSLTGVFLSTIQFKKGSFFTINVPVERNIFFYVIRGRFDLRGNTIDELHLVEFNNDQELLEMKAEKESILLFGHARPFNEPVVARGPFVMNTEQEIQQAYQDFYEGKMGTWQ